MMGTKHWATCWRYIPTHVASHLIFRIKTQRLGMNKRPMVQQEAIGDKKWEMKHNKGSKVHESRIQEWW